jgi:hypothetical protein
MEITKGSTIAVWFSCGSASAVASKLIVEKYGDTCDIRILNNPVVEEHEDNLRFLKDVQDWLGHPIESVVNPDYPTASAMDVWQKKRYMSGVAGAPCTQEVKRHERFTLTERSNVIPILIEENYSKQDCYDHLLRDGIEPPVIYKLGYPNANCIGCVKATSPTYWNHVRSVHPDVFEQRAVQSRDIGTRLVRHKGKRIFLDELPSDAIGRPMKNLDFECGIFCEEIK